MDYPIGTLVRHRDQIGIIIGLESRVNPYAGTYFILYEVLIILEDGDCWSIFMTKESINLYTDMFAFEESGD